MYVKGHYKVFLSSLHIVSFSVHFLPVQVFSLHIWPLLPLFFFFLSLTDCGYGNGETNRILFLLCQVS